VRLLRGAYYRLTGSRTRCCAGRSPACCRDSG
jgi:hypothetical protein